MSDALHLFFHNLFFLGGGIINIAIALGFLYFRRKKLDGLTVTFIGMTLSVAIFQISQVLGVMAPDAETSRRYFLFNLTNIPIQLFMTHWFLILIGKVRQRLPVLLAVYGTGLILLIVYILVPDTFLLPSVPKMYLPFYYNPGPLHWIMRVWFNLVGAYYFIEILVAYHRELDPVKKNRFLFVMLSILYGFIVGSTAILLVFNIQFDPLWASFFSGYVILLAYAMVRYHLFNVRILFEKAAWYALTTTVMVGIIVFANYSTDILQERFVNFPTFIVPLVSSVLAVAVGFIVWKRTREADLMKYEFITVIAHKFRTPLTHVRWIAENLLGSESDPERKKELEDIYQSNNRLINMTGTLIELSDTTNGATKLYKFAPVAICRLVNEYFANLAPIFKDKEIIVTKLCPTEEIFVVADEERLKYVLQTILENSAAYTPRGGRVTVNIERTSGKVYISVKDTGIGIRKGEASRIFSRFYRSRAAMKTDTEGFGVGLSLARSITRRMGGNIMAHSEGENLGSTFTIVLPRARPDQYENKEQGK